MSGRTRRHREPEAPQPFRPRRGIDLALLGILLVGILLRLPHATDEDGYFKDYADEATYFTTGYAHYRGGPDFPLPHGGSGLPLALEFVLWVSGVPGGDPVPQPHADASYQLTPDQVHAAHLAYAMTLGFNLLFILGVFALAAGLLGRDNPWSLLPPALVAVAPYQVTSNMRFLSEPLYAALVCFAIVFVLKAKKDLAYLYAAALCMAGAHLLRVTGLFLMAALALFAWFFLRNPYATRQKHHWHVLGSVAVFFLVCTPYLDWRAESLPGPFDYGVNGRYWTDNQWDFSDQYWQTYTPKTGGEKETMSDYFESHSVGHAAERLWHSLWWPLRDTFSLSPGSEPDKVFSGLETAAVAAAFGWGLSRGSIPAGQRWLSLTMFLSTNLPVVWVYPTAINPRFFLLLAPIAFVVVAGQVQAIPRPRLRLAVGLALPLAVLGVYTLRVAMPGPAVAHWLTMGGWALFWGSWPVLAWGILRGRTHWMARKLPPPGQPAGAVPEATVA